MKGILIWIGLKSVLSIYKLIFRDKSTYMSHNGAFPEEYLEVTTFLHFIISAIVAITLTVKVLPYFFSYFENILNKEGAKMFWNTVIAFYIVAFIITIVIEKVLKDKNGQYYINTRKPKKGPKW